MPKIRDLGINYIPATMRPPEIGMELGGCKGGVSNVPTAACTPKPKPKPKPKGKPKAKYKAGSLTHHDVAQLKRDLRIHIGGAEGD